ncbi:MAG: ABC transporter permease [Planctomycetaceae bacterium]|nr:ABC transporter permease [Planctomycetaceae bacterium]
MIIAMLKAQWTTLVRDRVALFLVFLLPIIFFSVFAIIFGGSGSDSGGREPAATRVAVLDLDQSKTARSMADSLADMTAVNVLSASELLAPAADDKAADAADPILPSEDDVVRLVRNNTVDAAVIFPDGLESTLANFSGDRPAIKVVYDSANPLAQNMLSGVLQGAAFTAVPDVLVERGLEQFENFGGPFSQQQSAAVEQIKNLLQQSDTGSDTGSDSADNTQAASGTDLSMSNGLVKIDTVSAREALKKDAPKSKKSESAGVIAYYAASVAVMFLMFSMAGSASALLEYQENGTLERMISGQMSISQLLTSHWVFFVLTGVAQLVVMFLFAVLAFGVDLSQPPVLVGTMVMSIVTAMASASFIIMLATLCRSRKQLESISTTVILIMSAFGGSMIPRPFLPSFVRETSKLTFNGWALDGFLKVLWYYDPDSSIFATLSVHILVILLMAAAFFAIAQWRVRRWAIA